MVAFRFNKKSSARLHSYNKVRIVVDKSIYDKFFSVSVTVPEKDVRMFGNGCDCVILESIDSFLGHI